jgi:hypothetical protein
VALRKGAKRRGVSSEAELEPSFFTFVVSTVATSPSTRVLGLVATVLTTWHPNQCRFKVSEAQKLTGKLARLAEGANWVFNLLSHLNLSIAYALSKNKRLLTESSAEFRDIVLAICTSAFVAPCKDLARHTSFAINHAAKLSHHASYQYNINKTMHHEIEFFRDKLKPDSGIKWEMPIAHLIS